MTHDFRFGDRVKLTDKAAATRRNGQVNAIYLGRGPAYTARLSRNAGLPLDEERGDKR
jgi:hypothetical protein